MRVFITGASGYIGSAVVAELARAGHLVIGLIRSAERERPLRALGADAVVGDLKNPGPWRQHAAECDASIHLGFEPSANAVAADLTAVEALLMAASSAGASRTVLYTSGVWVLGATGDAGADESSPLNPATAVAWRPSHEQRVLQSSSANLATAVIRPGMVWGGKGGIVNGFFRTAQADGAALVVGDGRNRWPPVHRGDLAVLYRLVLERRATGVFHGVEGDAPRVADMAAAASRAAGRNGAVRNQPLEQARQQMGPLADALCTDQVVRASRSRELGWSPRHRSFVEGAQQAWAEFSAD